jgi:hypothetical protein
MVQYPTTAVQDGLLRPQIPLCVQRLSGLWYCYDDQGNLIYIGSSPPNPPLKSITNYPSIYTSTIINPNSELLLASLGGSRIFAYQPGFVAGSPFFGFIKYIGSVSVPVGTSNTYGSTTIIYNNSIYILGTDFFFVTLPIYITVTWGGTFASGETVTVQLTFNIQAILGGTSTNASTTLSATSTGSQSLNINNIIAIIAPTITSGGYYTVSSITAAAASSASSTSVTVSVQAWILTS